MARSRAGPVFPQLNRLLVYEDETSYSRAMTRAGADAWHRHRKPKSPVAKDVYELIAAEKIVLDPAAEEE